MPSSSAFRINTGALDPFLRVKNNLPFMPAQYSATNDLVRERVLVDPIKAGAAPDTQISFQFEKEATLLEDLLLSATLTIVNKPATTCRFVDYVGIAFINKVEWKCAMNNLITYKADEAYLDHQRKRTATNAAKIDHMVKGNRSVAQRNADGTGPVEVLVPLPRWWEGQRGHSPIISALANKLTVNVTFEKAAKVIQMDPVISAGTLSYTITNVALDTQNIHTTVDDRNKLTAATQMAQGLVYFVRHYQNESFTLASGTKDFSFKLNNFDKPALELNILLRKTADLTTDWANKPYEDLADNWYDQTAVVKTDADAIDLAMKVTNEPNFVLSRDNANYGMYDASKYYNQINASEYMTINFQEYPLLKNKISGSYNFQTMTNPIITVDTLNNLTSELTMHVYALVVNFVSHQRGNLFLNF